MSRTGTFGRRPRSAPSLTNTLIAIAREFQNQRAQNIMDAWKQGGTFEGKKATDEEVLKFWREKAKGVSKDDPLHDTYQNAYTQLDYTIHESKMTAAYATGKATDGQMVAFYLGWAKKVPKNSEFYRVLQRDAGQYMRNQRARSDAAAKRAAEELYLRQQNETKQKKEAAGEYVIDTLRRIAQSGYADGGIAPAIAAPGSGSDLTDFDPTDPQTMLKLIGAIMPKTDREKKAGGRPGDEGEFRGNTDVIFHDDDGKGWTGQMILGELGRLDSAFKPGAPFDVNYVTGLLDRQMQGLNERIARATKTGHMSDVSELMKSKSYVSLLNREVSAYPVQKAYQEARSDYDAIVADKSSSPQAVLNAWATYQSTLRTLADDPRIAADDNLRSRLSAEANGDGGVPTLHESFTGLAVAGADAGSAKDSAENAKAIEFMQAQVEAVAGGDAVWTYGRTDANGVFQPAANGREIGAATREAAQAGGTNAQYMTVSDPRGGRPLQMLVTAVPVYATAKDPKTGEYLSVTHANPIAYAYDLPKGSGTQTIYGFETTNGFMFSADPPWREDLKTTSSAKGGDHIEVDLTPVVAQMEADPNFTLSKNTGPEGLGNGFHIENAKEVGPKGGESRVGVLVFDPTEATRNTDTRNWIGKPDPMSDFHSLTLANLMSDAEGHAIVSNLDKNPAFKQQLEADAYSYAGFQRDMKTGAWVPVEGADPNKLSDAQKQQALAANAQSFTDFITEAGKGWQRLFTGSPFKPTSVGNGAKTGQPGETPQGFTKLATDLLQNTPFQALANAFIPGTATIKPADRTKDDIFQIKTQGTVKVPTVAPYVPPAMTTQGPVAQPTAPYTMPASQTGSQPPSKSKYQQNQGQTYGGGV